MVPERRLINTLYKVDMKLMAPSKNVCLTIFKSSFINFYLDINQSESSCCSAYIGAIMNRSDLVIICEVF